MSGRDLHRARTEFWIGVFVGNDLEAAAGERLEDVLADHAFVARIARMHRDRHVGEHRFGARRRDHDMIAAVVRSEEHTSELQSLMRISYAVFCLKKKNNMTTMS